MMENDSEDVVAEICSAFTWFSDNEEFMTPLITNTNVLRRIVELTEHKNVEIANNCITIIDLIFSTKD